MRGSEPPFAHPLSPPPHALLFFTPHTKTHALAPIFFFYVYSGYGYLNVINATHLHWRFETSVAHVNSTSPFYTDDLTLVVESHGPRTNLPPV